MAKNYKNYRPVKQSFKMSCWAACLEWWSKYMSPTKPILTEIGLVYEARAEGMSPQVDAFDANYGGLEIQHIETMIERNDLCGMVGDRISSFSLTPEFINQKLAKGPMFISYHEPKVGGGHANIIIKCKTDWRGLSMLTVMEPDTGKFEKRTIDYYYNDGDTIIGYLN